LGPVAVTILAKVANSGHQLHILLETVRDTGSVTLATAWAAVLEADFGSEEFVRRHSEVVALLADFLGLVNADPDVRRRARNAEYGAAWWLALVHPTANWEDGSMAQGAGVIQKSDLDMLITIADVLEGGGDGVGPGAEELDQLRSAVVAVITEIEDAGLPLGLRTQLLHDMDHVIWCLDNCEMFGSGSVQRAAERATGAVIATIPRIPEGGRKSWKQHAMDLIAALTLLSGVNVAGQTAIEATQHTVKMIENMFSGTDPATDTDPDDSDIVDAELVPESQDNDKELPPGR